MPLPQVILILVVLLASVISVLRTCAAVHAMVACMYAAHRQSQQPMPDGSEFQCGKTEYLSSYCLRMSCCGQAVTHPTKPDCPS